MKPAGKLAGHSQPRARQLLCLVIGAFRSPAALLYWWRRNGSEKNGSPFTAALEWRKAAELVDGPMADRCWIEWERIMHLPRHLASPIV